jgi:hypothetical protein
MLEYKKKMRWIGVAMVVVGILGMVSSANADTVWMEKGKLTASDGQANDRFGYTVSISGDYAIIGAFGSESSKGAAYIFKRSDNPGDPNWYEQYKMTASDGASGYGFGWSVSISGDYAIIGARYKDNETNRGPAYIFKRSETPNDPNWYEQCKLATGGSLGPGICPSVSIDGDYAIVGASDYEVLGQNNRGTAYIFKRDGSSWSEQAMLLASDSADSDYFGWAVSIRGEYAVIGSSHDDDNGWDSGSAYIFKREGTVWTEQDKLISSDGTEGNTFGCGVSIDGEYAIIASRNSRAYIFKREGTAWNQHVRLLAPAASDPRVSLSGDYAIVGSHNDVDNGFFSGSAYVYNREGDTWTQQVRLLASDGAAEDWFGLSVALSPDFALVGASKDDDKGNDSGSAYIFKKIVCPDADLNGDCCVNLIDLSIFAIDWLQCVEQ